MSVKRFALIPIFYSFIKYIYTFIKPSGINYFQNVVNVSKFFV